MNANEHIEVDDLAMFALLLSSERESAEIRQHLSECTACRAELAQVRRGLGEYALAVAPVSIPSGSRERFAAMLGSAMDTSAAPRSHGTSGLADKSGSHVLPGASPVQAAGPALVTSPGRPVGRGSAGRVLPWIGWAAAAAVLFVALGLKQDRDSLRTALMSESAQTASVQARAERSQQILHALTDPHAVRVNLTIGKAPVVPAARATYDPKTGTLLLLASNLAPLHAQKVYELWIIPADGTKPVPAGTFMPDAHGSVSTLMPAVQGAIAAKAFGITIENEGGSATPTMPILLAGAPG
jgi:hypothetical protein